LEFMQESESLSLLEQLPQELAWKIMENVPDAVFELRLTSKVLKSRVDEYALQRATFPLVETLEFSKINLDGDFEIILKIPKHNADLFELRLKLRRSGPFSNTHMKRSRRVKRPNEYSFLYDDQLMNFVNEYTGTQLETVMLTYSYGQTEYSIISEILSRFGFRNLNVKFEAITDDLTDLFFQTIETCKVESCTVQTDNNTASNPVEFLLGLSSLVRSIFIVQPEHFLDRQSRILFGIRDIHWAPVIFDMFSRKLDKLEIENQYCQEYLSDNDILILKERLPFLNKKIWFEATCNVNPQDRLIRNDHSITIKQNYGLTIPSSTLVIKHLSREHEQFEDH
ncbi:hypothetical protein PENTCL1PPCAC_18873, partial [Pristionchus entomophagus]